MEELRGNGLKLFEAVLKIESDYGYQEANSNSSRIKAIREAIDKIAGQESENETLED